MIAKCLSCDLEMTLGGEGFISLCCPNCGDFDFEFDSPILLARVREKYGVEVGDFKLIESKAPFFGKHPTGAKWDWKNPSETPSEENLSDPKKRSKLKKEKR